MLPSADREELECACAALCYALGMGTASHFLEHGAFDPRWVAAQEQAALITVCTNQQNWNGAHHAWQLFLGIERGLDVVADDALRAELRAFRHQAVDRLRRVMATLPIPF